MTIHRDWKRVVRARMRRTGESYTAARARVLEKPRPAGRATTAARPLPAAAAARPGMSDEAVRAKTGRTWAQWVRTLDAIGATGLRHAAIAKHLRTEHDLTPWWSQMVAVGYERLRGLRDVGQRRGGTYDVGRTRTFAVPLARLERAFRIGATRARWLPGVTPRVLAARSGRSVRFEWPDGTRVEVAFVDKGPAKSQVSVQHLGLPSRARADRVRAEWGERLDALGEFLARG